MWFRDVVEKARAWQLERRRAQKFARRQAYSAGLTVPETFEKIYAENKWGRAKNGARFYSGDGSLPKHSRGYEDFVAAHLEADSSIATWVDIGCGDFQVASRILDRINRPVRYIGCDTAANVIAHHQATVSRPGVAFLSCNAAVTDPPAADLITIRQVLQHLSNGDVQRILDRIKRLCSVAIISESLPTRLVAPPNVDIGHGIAVRVHVGSGVYIDQPPFSLKVVHAVDSPYSEKEVVRTSVVRF